jgi:hypothetical protein
VSNETWVFVCTGIEEGDSRAWTWWYGGETLSLKMCIVLDPADETIFVLSSKMCIVLDLADETIFALSSKMCIVLDLADETIFVLSPKMCIVLDLAGETIFALSLKVHIALDLGGPRGGSEGSCGGGLNGCRAVEDECMRGFWGGQGRTFR